ncbi:hypothetical protein WJR50_15215 [Catalinimonas sp. 4WD22]|uniref:hypothetical protein n=1 Tax=Catalinimonas locisalis TaxID=3133978 RepID=UPI00310169D7
MEGNASIKTIMILPAKETILNKPGISVIGGEKGTNGIAKRIEVINERNTISKAPAIIKMMPNIFFWYSITNTFDK